MNKIIMTIVLALSTMISLQAQNIANGNNVNSDKNAVATQPVVTKGYYSIYKNSEKLNKSQPISIVAVDDKSLGSVHTKGYYAIGNHHQNIYKSGKSFIVKTPKRPMAAKGYYSIKNQVSDMNINNTQQMGLVAPATKDSSDAAGN